MFYLLFSMQIHSKNNNFSQNTNFQEIIKTFINLIIVIYNNLKWMFRQLIKLPTVSDTHLTHIVTN